MKEKERIRYNNRERKGENKLQQKKNVRLNKVILVDTFYDISIFVGLI